MVVEDLGVADVGRVAAEDVVAERRAAEHLGDESEVEQAETQAPALGRLVRRPETDLAHAGAQRRDRFLDGGPRLVEQWSLERHELCVDERSHAPGQFALAVRKGEVHAVPPDGRRDIGARSDRRSWRYVRAGCPVGPPSRIP